MNPSRNFSWPELANPWKKASQPVKWAFLAACFFGVLTHIYIFTNLILNHDSVWRLFYDNANLGLGRWSLQLLSEFSTRFQLPVVIAFISVIMLAFTAGITVSVLDISNRIIAVLTAAFLVTIPSVACIFSYMFTADAYFICLFLNALAVYFGKRFRWGWFPAIVLCTLACGAYQAFICYAIGLFLIDCILELFTDKPVAEIVKKGAGYIGIIIASLGLYYLILMALLAIKGTALSSYQGFSTINPMDFAGFLSKVPQAYKSFWEYFKTSPFSTGACQVIQVLFLFLAGGALAYLAAVSKLYRNWVKTLLLLLGVLLLPLALNFVTILVQEGTVHALMIYSFVLLYVFSLKTVEMTLQKMIENQTSDWLILHFCSAVLAGILIWNNFCVSNMAYLRLQVCYENSFALANRIVARIEALDGYSPELPVAVVGEASRALYGGTIGEFSQINSLTGTNDWLLYSSEPHIRTRTFIEHYMGLHMPTPGREQKELLNSSEWIKELPSYPAKGSVVMYEGIIVVKLSDGAIR